MMRAGGLPRAVAAHFLRDFARPTETFVVNQAACLDRYEAHVVCRTRRPNAPRADCERAIEHVHAYVDDARESHCANIAYRTLRVALPAERRWYRAAIEDAGAVVVHAHFGTDAGYLLPALEGSGLPLVVSWYGYDVSSFPLRHHGAGALWLQRILARADLHLAMTPKMAEDLEALRAPPDRIRVHHHGIDVSAWDSDPEALARERGTHRVLQVASINAMKGQADVLRALVSVAELIPDVSLHLVGTGNDLAATKQLAASLGLASRVTFLGHVPHGAELAREYQQADVFIHPSYVGANGAYEGLPNTILEAMASSLPVVATQHGGIPFAVTEDTGVLVEERDHAGLARAMIGLLLEPKRARALGSAGRERVTKLFNLRCQLAHLEDIYDEVRRF